MAAGSAGRAAAVGQEPPLAEPRHEVALGVRRDERLEDVPQDLGLLDDLRALPDGLDTVATVALTDQPTAIVIDGTFATDPKHTLTLTSFSGSKKDLER